MCRTAKGMVTALGHHENALDNFTGSAVVTSHDRWFLDRIAIHIVVIGCEGKVVWFEENVSGCEKDREARR